MAKRILVACEYSGLVREAFAQRGHFAVSCDVRPTEIPGHHYQGDVLDILYEDWDMLIAFPPCTFLANIQAKWYYHPKDKHLPISERRPDPRFPHRRRDQKKAIEFFMALAEAPIAQICIENPIGVMSTHWRKPDQIICPTQFGHSEPKKTCLWLKGLPLLQPTKIVEADYIVTKKSKKRVPRWMFEPSPSEDRQKDRELTFPGIADVMGEWD